MKRRLSILLGVGILTILSAGIYWQSRVDHKSSFIFFEPRYQGESLSYWLLHLYSYDQRGRHFNSAARDALLQTGTDALPLLLNWISKPEPGIVTGTIEYQRHAVDGFEILGPAARPAIPRLIKNVGRGSYYSMQALEFIGKDAVPALTNKLLETLADKHEAVMNWRDPRYQRNFFHGQATIIRGLREMGTNAETAIPVLIRTLYANHGWQWEANPYAALVSVGQNRPDTVIQALVEVLTNSSAPAVNRGAIAIAMSSFGTNRADQFVPVLTRAINDRRTDDSNRRTMAGALVVVGRNRPDSVVPLLVEAFTNTATEYRDGIAEALGALGNDARTALPLLLPASQSPYFYLREKASIAVKKIAPEKSDALDPLFNNLRHADPGFRQQAIYALAKLGTNAPEAIPVLLKCLSHPNTQTRIDATRALNELGAASDEFIYALSENLSGENSFMVQEAEETLAKLAPHSNLAFLTLVRRVHRRGGNQRTKGSLIEISRNDPTFMLECLEDTNTLSRSGALSVFYELARLVPNAIPKLQALSTDDPDQNVRSQAADVLKLQGQFH